MTKFSRNLIYIYHINVWSRIYQGGKDKIFIFNPNSERDSISLVPNCIVGIREDPGFILLSSHQQRDPQCWPFQQQPMNRLQSHPKQLWGAAESGFCRRKRDITIPLVLTNNNYAINSFDIHLNSFAI